MSGFESFDSFEEMFKVMTAREDAVNLTLLPVHRQFMLDTAHRWFVRADKNWPMIYGDVYSDIEFDEMERAYISKDGYTRKDHVEAMHRYSERKRRGYLFARCYSQLETRGELGDTHVSRVIPAPQSVFDAAQETNWPELLPLSVPGWKEALATVYNQIAEARGGD